MTPKALVIDDDDSLCEAIAAHLELEGYEVSWCTGGPEGLERIVAEDYDVVLVDLNMPKMNGIEVCQRAVQSKPGLPVIVITAFGRMESAVAALRAGAYDFITKPVEMELLTRTLARATERKSLIDRVNTLEEAISQQDRFEELIGSSAPMKRLFSEVARIAKVELPVLISGESGTGKELVARALHRLSSRSKGPFIAVNCAALPDSLIESELFGHVRGAFTSAGASRTGLFLQADGGTLLLDEIAELPQALQSKLLRALEEGTLRPVGSDRQKSFDVRVLAATNRDLEAAVEAGRFRQDLLFRINAVQIELPALRARGTDVLLLAKHFLLTGAEQANKDVPGLSPEVSEKLLSYSWPGNVRELKNAILRAVALNTSGELQMSDLPAKIREHEVGQVSFGGHDPEELAPLEEVERQYILHVFEVLGQHRTKVARALGLDRKTLYRKLLRYGVLNDEGD